MELAKKLNAIAWAAGAITLEYFQVDTAVESKADDSPVTQADRAVEEFILAELEKACPGIPVVAEEAVSAGSVPASADRFFLVDPLDGTKEFIAGRSDYTVNIALIEKNQPVCGVVHAPARGTSYAGGRECGAYLCRGEEFGDSASRIAVRHADPAGIVAVASRSHNSPETDAFLAKFEIAERVSVGSSLKFCLLAAGEADLYPRFGRTMEWDTAAGHAVLLAAGGGVMTDAGVPLAYDKRDQTSDSDFANPHFIAFADPEIGSKVEKMLKSTDIAKVG
ncbi:3'(2'),5'-bisphosphate nucleotidase CysQ [Stappia sp. GBMRC 2046]|uniref:3'(2'),5'-bisphosphate nucleotidase CysQ n=1 Tax=Stappia sediminis TaxID=2692190 RepID=A0A7X3LY43_9HYPH|nr:3'(2'),5'-bisphosphate nucleotidase CysQ [Stappia sediminis]